MIGNRIALGCSFLWMGLAGCGSSALEAPPSADGRIAGPPASRAPEVNASNVEVSWDTPKDERFAEFLRDNSGGMIGKAAVGIERKGRLEVVLDRSVAPEDTLDMTKSLMAGARKDFPDRAFTLAVFDPQEAPILKAHVDPSQGVRYELANGDGGARSGGPAPVESPVANEDEGPSKRDQQFAEWAMRTGKEYLRYVQADIERHGRLWFGVTSDVKPADVPGLTKSLLEGARSEFPRGELMATVFDPEGEKIGRATLGHDGEVRWER